MKKVNLAAVLAATAALGLAAPVHADDHFVRTEVHWAGAPCIDVWYAHAAHTKTVCDSRGIYIYTEGNVWDGDQIGVDPMMGSAGYIECKMWIDGVLSWSDAAYAGDGSDVSCARTKL